MLAACRAHGWPFAGYRHPDHPLQQRVAELIGPAETAIDGCGLTTYAQPLTLQAQLLLRTPPRVAAAMRARPELVGRVDGADVALMLARPGWLAKTGAEGLVCAVSPEGVGYALKAEDGNTRALGPAIGAVLGIDELVRIELRNTLGEPVGAIEVE
jgi:L-asparaginase II